MSQPTQKEVQALVGLEIDYQFKASMHMPNVPAYVAKADLNIGITIMGRDPEDTEGVEDDIVLSCCFCDGQSDHPEYLEIVQGYIKQINSGLFTQNGATGGGDAAHMASACRF